MITPRHNKDAFYKYYPASVATLTLQNTTRKWSTPFLFNDPFDNQFDLYFEEPSEAAADENLARFLEMTTSPEPLKDNQFGSLTPFLEMIRQARLRNPDFKFTEEEIAYIREGQTEGMHRVIKITPETNAEIRRLMADTSIFCLSETYDSLLMWSHYANNHTGVVIKFLSLPEVDSPLMMAQPVCYSAQMPRLRFSMLLDFDKARNEVINTITLTKGDVWAYEKEWRIVTTLRDKTQTYEIIPYAPEEVGAVYLGCKIAETDRDEIIEVTRRKYPKAKIFRADKHDREYELVFQDIT
jgi:DUF2971 family protein